MALSVTKLNFKGIEIPSAYVKATLSAIQERGSGKDKVFSCLAIYEVKTSKDSEVIFSENIAFDFDSNLGLHKQAYDKIKTIYPNSLDV